MKASLQYEVTDHDLETEQVAPGLFAAKTNKVVEVAFFDRSDTTQKEAAGPRKAVRLTPENGKAVIHEGLPR